MAPNKSQSKAPMARNCGL